MEPKQQFKKLLDALDPNKPTAENVDSFKQLGELWDSLRTSNVSVTECLTGSNIFMVLAFVLEANYDEWRKKFPEGWVWKLHCYSSDEKDYDTIFPLVHLEKLEKVYRKYLLNGSNDTALFNAYRWFAVSTCIKDLVLRDDDVYNILKKDLQFNQLNFLYTLSSNETWQLKMLEDKQLIIDLLKCPLENDVLDVFVHLASHPDAKILLPKDVIVKASKSKYSRKMDLCALLCNEDNLKVLELDTSWVSTMSTALHKLITTGSVKIGSTWYVLLELVLPIVNLTIVESLKDILGKQFIQHLIPVVTDELPQTRRIMQNLARSRVEASKALWNLAFLEANRTLISKGKDKLAHTLATTDDADLKKNISGILQMISNPPGTVIAKSAAPTQEAKRGHVMISYNWGNQPIVKRLAKTLQDNGYKVWLDIEQMGGSTLEAMASAIEGAEAVLICMSQKYKDSPNCRLEGEYCVNRKVPYIPLMMQKGYQPDGWLGIALGAKLYYEFADEDNWESKITELVKAIGVHGKHDAPKREISAAPAISQPTTTIVDWSNEELLAWMKANRIERHFELFMKHTLNRSALLELQKVRQESATQPSFFFNVFKDLGISEFGQVLLISAAIRSLK